jgi:hypothetical protein
VKTEDRTEDDEDNKTGGQRAGDLGLAPVKCKSNVQIRINTIFVKRIFLKYPVPFFIQHCFTCHPSDSTVSEDAGIEKTLGYCDFGIDSQTLYKHSPRSHPM